MPTTARGIWTPSDTDAVDFTTDLATMAGTIDSALELYGNALRGTASQRAAFLSTAVDGMLWQDTDGIRMIWRKDGALWVPAVWRWRGTTAQMNSFGANAPDGFEWFSTTNNSGYVRLGGAWLVDAETYTPSFISAYTASTLKLVRQGVMCFSVGSINRSSGAISLESNVLSVAPPARFMPAMDQLVVGIGAGVQVAKVNIRQTGVIQIAGLESGYSASYLGLNGAWMSQS